MMSRAEDLGVHHPPIPVANDSEILGVIQILIKSSVEMKNLLLNECSVLLECRSCGSIFRGVISFLTHKRTCCRTLFSNTAQNYDPVIELAKEALRGIKLFRITYAALKKMKFVL
ncbi:unnamed protein product [Gongylonema pulchrum]|uniref:C2H2-type domain-containing protein n=1 Tax=Gongylonema pulchrum TaxID=637853 RepID=A0A183EEJ8_9BILA|nr:unnamed protein product [Gongylonema pulchrum]